VIAAGGILVSLDPGLSEDALRRALAGTGAVHAIASDETQLARILRLRPELPALELVLLSSAAPSERRPAALLVDAAMGVGAAALNADPGVLEPAAGESKGRTALLLVDRAGDTRPVTTAALSAQAQATAQELNLTRGGALLVALPLGGVDRLGAAIAALERESALLLQSPGDRPDSGLDQRSADAILLDSGGLQRLHEAWLADIGSMSWLARGVTRWALTQGRKPPPRGWKLRIADRIALRRLRAKLGGKATVLDVIGQRPPGGPAEAESFFAAIGVPIRYRVSGGPGSLAR
jgi:hypothetical protein